MNIFLTLPYSVFFHRIPNISGARLGCPAQICIKTNNNSRNRSICRWYASAASLLNFGDLPILSLPPLSSINCSLNLCSLNILLYNHHCPSTANLVRSSSKNDYPTLLSVGLSTIDSQSMLGFCPSSTIINSNNSFLASSTNLCTMEWA